MDGSPAAVDQPTKRSRGSDDEYEAQLIEARAKAAAKASLARRQKLNETSDTADESEETRRQRNHGEGPSRPSSSPPLQKLARPSGRAPLNPPIPPRSAHPPILQCSPVSDYVRLNHIEEGTYGIVFRARHVPTGDIVAVKKLKMQKERNGFPITSLREIKTLMMCRECENVVNVREVAVGDTLTQ